MSEEIVIVDSDDSISVGHLDLELAELIAAPPRPNDDAPDDAWDAWDEARDRERRMMVAIADAHVREWTRLLENEGFIAKRIHPADIATEVAAGRLDPRDVVADDDPRVVRLWHRAWETVDIRAVVEAEDQG